MREQQNNETMTQPTNNQAVNEIIANLNNGVVYQNDAAGYQFVLREGGLMLRYQNGKYTFYNDIVKFAMTILRATKRGY